MTPSRIVLLLVALLAGGLAAFLATRGDQPVSNSPVTEVVQEARTQILVAKVEIGMGERLSAESVEWQDWPEGAVRPEYITIAATPEALTDMTGAVARFEFFAGEPIREQKLVRTEQGYLSAVLSKGMRGVSVAVNANAASGGFIVPNDHVDVVLTHSTPTGDVSETIVENVRVLAINTRLGELGSTGAPADPSTPRTEIFANDAIATLELDPIQGETVINAANSGKLSLALRSIVDFDAPMGSSPDRSTKQAIRVIRYGAEASVMTGTSTMAPAGEPSVDPAAFTQPVTVTPGVTPSTIPAPVKQ